MQKKKGISLIVLVITIIVMIILAAAVIISMNNAGVIERASHAVKLTDEKQVQDLAALAWAEAYLDENRTETIEKVVKDELKEYGVTEEDWNINVTETGVIVTSKLNSSNTPTTIPEPIVITSANYPNAGTVEDYKEWTPLETWCKVVSCTGASKYKVIISEDTLLNYDEAEDFGDTLGVFDYTGKGDDGMGGDGYSDPSTYQGREGILDGMNVSGIYVYWSSYRSGAFKISIYPLDENGEYLTNYQYTITDQPY